MLTPIEFRQLIDDLIRSSMRVASPSIATDATEFQSLRDQLIGAYELLWNRISTIRSDEEEDDEVDPVDGC